MRPLAVRWLGLVPYAEALRLQDELVQERRRGAVPDTLLLLEHPPVVTLGRSARPQHVRRSAAELAAAGVEIHECGRGGDVTYHAPGQLVGYPVLALEGPERDLHRHVRRLEDALLATSRRFGVRASRAAGLTGIWCGGRKLGAIGVRVSVGWITSHGYALNVTVDLRGFEAIVPCGIADRGVTSILELTGRAPHLREVAAAAAIETARAVDRAPALEDLALARSA